MENPITSYLQKVSILNDFVKTLFVSQMVTKIDHQMKSFRRKFCRLWVRYGDSGKDWKMFETSLEAVEVPVDTFATLIEQITLALGQASL